jgi:hypothetical protein
MRWIERTSNSLNPKGCQRVAGGRRGFFLAATSGQWRRRSPAPRLGCQIRHCRACSRLEEHHRQRTFEQELRELLEKHGVQYDPKYLL